LGGACSGGEPKIKSNPEKRGGKGFLEEKKPVWERGESRKGGEREAGTRRTFKEKGSPKFEIQMKKGVNWFVHSGS